MAYFISPLQCYTPNCHHMLLLAVDFISISYCVCEESRIHDDLVNVTYGYIGIIFNFNAMFETNNRNHADCQIETSLIYYMCHTAYPFLCQEGGGGGERGVDPPKVILQ